MNVAYSIIFTMVVYILDVKIVKSGAMSGAIGTSSSVIWDSIDAATVLDGLEYVQSIPSTATYRR